MRRVKTLQQRVKSVTSIAALAARESDMGMVGPVFGPDATERGGGHDVALERGEILRGQHSDMKDAGAFEDVGDAEMNSKWWTVNLTEAGEERFVARLVDCAEKLQGDVPGLRAGPTQAVAGAA